MTFRSFILAQLALLASLGSALAEETPTRPDKWDNWAEQQSRDQSVSLVQPRKISKASRFQLVGPAVGLGDRNDLYMYPMVSLGARYHFTELHAWEFLRLSMSFPIESPLAGQIREQSGLLPDSQLSRFQLTSSYVISPIYGKYLIGEEKIVHFSIFGTVGAGVRFANDVQPLLEAGVGMDHFVWGGHFSIIPEFRVRTYFERRSTGTPLIAEGVFQIGTAWLF
ncbi:MAG: hypothetical protein ACXWPM_03820 [Bdellovibrionota bacterium]